MTRLGSPARLPRLGSPSSEGHITVFDRATGERLWNRDVPGAETWYPSVGPGDVVLLSEFGTGKVRVLDDRTGNEVRSFDGVAGDRAATANGRVAFVSLQGTFRKLEVKLAR